MILAMEKLNLRKPIEEISAPQNISIFYKLRKHPVYMQVPLKSGCTYLKNLFYHIDHEQTNPLGDFIHEDETGLIKAGPEDMDAVCHSPYVFFVIRNPVNRFLSLYFDKIANPNDRAFNWFRNDYAAQAGLKFGADLTLEEHKENAVLLIDWIKENLDRETDPYPDPHWQPQIWRHMQVKEFKPLLLPLDRLDEVLPVYLGDEIPDIQSHMNAVRSRNKSYKPFSHDDMRHWKMTKRIRDLYVGDFKLYDKARRNAKKILGEVDVSNSESKEGAEVGLS